MNHFPQQQQQENMETKLNIIVIWMEKYKENKNIYMVQVQKKKLNKLENGVKKTC